MSGFLIKRDAKQGGAVPASSPNVGQYGWTTYETAHYNQMIEYVGLAQASAQTSVDAATYTTKVLEEEIKPAVASAKASESQVIGATAEFSIAYTDFSSKYEDFLSKYNSSRPLYGDLVFSNGWEDFGDVFETSACFKQGPVVTLKGLVKRASGTSNTIGVLPNGFRPITQKALGLFADDKIMRLDILPSGELTITSTGGANLSNWVSLENVSFLI